MKYFFQKVGIDVLRSQPIKLIKVISNSEFDEYWWNDLVFTKSLPWFSAGPQELQKLTASKTKYEKFGQKF